MNRPAGFSPGLSPAWRLQYVLVKDLQTGSSYYFLVEEWLSVDNEKTDGRVEIEVEASGEPCPPFSDGGFGSRVTPLGSRSYLLCFFFPLRGGRSPAAAAPPQVRAAEGAV